MNADRLRLVTSIGAIGLVLLHLLFPKLAIDGVTIGLLIVAAVPWIGPLLRSLADSGLRNLELPGGIKIELADVKAATDKVTKSSLVVRPAPATATVSTSIDAILIQKPKQEAPDPVAYIKEVANSDPNLGLVAFRIEIEKRLRRLAEANGIETRKGGLAHLVRHLRENQVLPVEMASGLLDLVALGNRAAHGVEVSPEAAAWVMDTAPSIIFELDEIRKTAGTQNNVLHSDADKAPCQ